MAAPPSQGSSPWPQDAAGDAASSDPLRERLPGEGAVGRSRRSRRQEPLAASATAWLWLPVALSGMLLVLLVVVIQRQQDQARRLGDLFSRVQILEQSRALERTAVLEQQLRSMLTRLQDQEKLSRQQEQLVQQLQTVQQELQRLRAIVRSPLVEPLDGTPPAEEGRRSARPSGTVPLTTP